MEAIATTVWQSSKILLKALLIGGMALVLLIPSLFLQDIIREREQRQKEAVWEVSSKWAGRQVITGPVLIIPYKDTATNSRHEAYFLPTKLDVKSKLNPEKRSRGIYEVMLYTSETSIKGSFSPIPFSTLKISPADVLWNEVSVNIGISDPKGLKSDIQLTFNDSTLSLAPVSSNDTYSQNTFTAPFALTETGTMNTISFSGNLSLNGSEQLLFTPVGKETTVELNSPWPDPSFIGNQLPVSHSVTKDGFVATWKNLSHTRKFPQQWKDNAYTISYTQEMEKKSVDDSYNTADVARVTTPIVGTGNSVTAEAFGTSLFVPVNGYQKTMRSVKYAILCILLTFAAFFIIEMVNKKTVHPFQYGLIGLALIVFYALLLSFSEYTGFNTAYIISTLATVGLIGWFVKGILQSSRLTTILSSLLILMYSYIFTILQLQDYSLILGSIGLFLTLAVIMHFSKKIKW